MPDRILIIILKAFFSKFLSMSICLKSKKSNTFLMIKNFSTCCFIHCCQFQAQSCKMKPVNELKIFFFFFLRKEKNIHKNEQTNKQAMKKT